MVRFIGGGVTLILALVLAGCIMGTDFSQADSTKSPYGPAVSVSVDKMVGGKKTGESYVYTGELFEVRRDGVVVFQRPGRLIFAGWHIAQINVTPLGISTSRAAPAPRDLELLRLSSRHPYGLTPEQLKLVLAELKQPAIIEVGK